MALFERPTASEQLISLNDDLDVSYSVFKNDFTYRRAANSYRLWRMQEFVPPSQNAIIADMYQRGVSWTFCEHVSVAINGTADYVFESPDGPITQVWSYGWHNVENGGGYLPFGEFTRTFHDDFTLCCVIQKFKRATDTQYAFEVVKVPKVLERDVLFVHYATGPRQTQTDFNLKAGDMVEIATPDDIAIVGWVR